MSGEFLKEAEALGGFDPEVRINFSRELQVKCWREILDVIEAATIYSKRFGVVRDHGKIVSLGNRLAVLDAKAKEKLLKPKTCMYCGRSNVVKVEKADSSPYVDHYELDFKCEDCLAEWVDHIYSGKPPIHKLVKAGIP